MSYNTKQREILLNFFMQNHDKIFCAEEIAEQLIPLGVSKSAVYRNLNDLEKSGKVRKTIKSGTRKAYYQFVDLDCCKDYLHLSCEKCGKTTHLSQSDANVLSTILERSNFQIDTKNTVLYGVCDNCKK